MSQAAIPLVDLSWQHRQIEAELLPALATQLQRTDFILGEQVRQFEEAFAAFSGARWCRGVASGTDAIELALRASGIGVGDEVLLPANTFIASAAAVLRAGAVPRLIDCDPTYQLMDPQLIESAITPRTRAILAVHLFGQIAPMQAINELAQAHRLLVLEDAAQSHGAKQNGQAMGQFGMAAATSFYPGKNLGAYGDAGAVLTDSDQVAEKVTQLRNHGSTSKYQHDFLGTNSRLDTLQAVVLQAKLAHLGEWNHRRLIAANRYRQLLADARGIELPQVAPGNAHVWHLYVVRVPNRDQVAAAMRARGIEVGVHYPLPVHLQPAMQHLGYKAGAFPEAEQAASEILSLPLCPAITPEQQERVATELQCALAESSRCN